eukprot:TRINITY_DN2382_c0_g1_i6.p1 TRINITY_DN2382_c0_g1~~TRINITY_DN2382_c0_g1_i6.p1  ORF type:complete len:400 (-),score=51.91 TRINITY_DN2382_c0_g1_i6:183-1253(-)
MECRPCMLLQAPLDDSKISLTVKLLCGDNLATLTARPRSAIRELKQRLEFTWRSTGRVVRCLVWGTRDLHDDETLHDLGICDGEELLAICVDGIEGDFEVFEPGCPSCDHNADLRRVCFDLDGIAMIQNGPYDSSKAYRYFLREVQEHEMHLEFVDDAVTPPKVVSGVLHMGATSHIDRRVRIPELDIDVRDVRYLKQRGRSWVQLKVEQMLFVYEGDMDLAFSSVRQHDMLPHSADVEEALTRAWGRWKSEQEHEEMTALEDDLMWLCEPQRQKPHNHRSQGGKTMYAPIKRDTRRRRRREREERKAKHAPWKRDARRWRQERERQTAKDAARTRDTRRWRRERALTPGAQLELD